MKFDKFTDVCVTGGICHTLSHTKVCKLTFSQLILHLTYAETLQGYYSKSALSSAGICF